MSILPPVNSPLQHALAKMTTDELAAVDWRVIIHAKDPAHCEAKWLPWLAWGRSIGDAEGWDFAETDTARRNIIADYIPRHQLKGTPDAIRRLFRDLQLGEVEIIERASALRWDGTAKFDGKYLFGGGEGDWAKYAVIVKRVISLAQAAQIRRILAECAPLRCELIYLDFRANPLKWNGEIRFDGTHTFGAITYG